jgi:hypothetical protein
MLTQTMFGIDRGSSSELRPFGEVVGPQLHGTATVAGNGAEILDLDVGDPGVVAVAAEIGANGDGFVVVVAAGSTRPLLGCEEAVGAIAERCRALVDGSDLGDSPDIVDR